MRVHRFVVAGLLVHVGCSSRAGLPTCEAPGAEVVAHARPDPDAASSPLEAGDRRAVLRIQAPTPTSKELAARSMVLACALTRGQAEATPVLIEWAEMAEDGYDLGASPFSDTDLDVEYRPDELGRLTVSLPEPRAPDAHDQPRPNDQIDRDTALERATALTRDLVAAGILVPGAFGDTPVHESTRVTGDGSTSWTTSYSFEFGFEHGGVVVVGPTLRVRIGSDGTPLEIGLADPDVSSVDTAVLTLDEASASEQFEELARATFPFPDQEYEFRVGGEKPVYVLDPGEADGTHEVRWMGVFAFDYNGTAGRPNVAALSMVSPDDGLTALTP